MDSVKKSLHTAETLCSDVQNAVLSMKDELDALSRKKDKKIAEIEKLDLEKAYLEEAVPAAQKELTQLREAIVSEQNTFQDVQNAVLSAKDKLDVYKVRAESKNRGNRKFKPSGRKL